MRMPIAIVLMAVCLIGGFALGFKFVHGQQSTEDDQSILNTIMTSENQIVSTLEKNDIDAFAKLIPDDLIDIEDDGIHNKVEWLDIIRKQKDAGYLFTQIRFENPHLLRLSADAAIMYSSEKARDRQRQALRYTRIHSFPICSTIRSLGADLLPGQ